jgi:hypothetical protein
MTVKITSKELPGLENHSYDLTDPGHFKGFMDQLEQLFRQDTEFTVMEIQECERYFRNLNHT